MTARQFSAALKKLDLGQREFARIAGVNERTVRNWVQGRRGVPNPVVTLLKMMLDAL